ncbi:MAG TPA: ECF-type sigma factor [Thermoguttaceae bacterium]|nr:ECF-type sigma factor [Thermoguttaceae bacterium]
MSDDEITVWLAALARGDELASQRIWEHYCHQLIDLARKKLGQAGRRAADEEDVALSAFNSFCQGAMAGRFPRLDDRHDLWRLLVTITARKAIKQMRDARRQKRGGAIVRGESALHAGIGQVLGREPTPDFAAQMAEQTQRLLDLLEDESLKLIALLKLEGYTNEEIARSMDCSVRTVKRRLARIRQEWEHAVGDATSS